MRTSEGEIKFFFYLFLFKRESVLSKKKKKKGVTLTGVSKNGGDVRVGGGGVEMQRGRRRTHVEDITVRVKAQSFFMVRFVRGSRCS